MPWQAASSVDSPARDRWHVDNVVGVCPSHLPPLLCLSGVLSSTGNN